MLKSCVILILISLFSFGIWAKPPSESFSRDVLCTAAKPNNTATETTSDTVLNTHRILMLNTLIENQLNRTTVDGIDRQGANSVDDIDKLNKAKRKLNLLASKEWGEVTTILREVLDTYLDVMENKKSDEEMAAFDYAKYKYRFYIDDRALWTPPPHCYFGPLKGREGVLRFLPDGPSNTAK